jgi:transcription initiation factor TFIID subunit 3
MKKHSKTGVDSRYQATILGKPADVKPIKIEGGPVESIEEWCEKTREKMAKTQASAREHRETSNHTEGVVSTDEEVEDVNMDAVAQ